MPILKYDIALNLTHDQDYVVALGSFHSDAQGVQYEFDPKSEIFTEKSSHNAEKSPQYLQFLKI